MDADTTDPMLARVAALASGADPRAERARRVAEAIRDVSGHRWVGLYDVLADEIVAIAWTGADAPAHPRFSRGLGLNGVAVATGDAVVVGDVSKDPRYLTTFPNTGSEAVLPIRPRDGPVVGTLDVESGATDAFGADDIAFLRACARTIEPLWDVACRPARPDDVDAIARIYNQGIEDRAATFETRARTGADVLAWLANPVLVAQQAGAVLGWAALSPTSSRSCYAGVLELSIYVDRAARGRGAGRALGEAILAAAEAAGAWKVIGKLFTENRVSASLVRALGFREVGVHRRHGRLDGAWRDVLIVEKLVGDAARGA